MKYDGVPYVNVGRIIYQCQFGSDLKKKKKKKSSVSIEDEKAPTVVEDEEDQKVGSVNYFIPLWKILPFLTNELMTIRFHEDES